MSVLKGPSAKGTMSRAPSATEHEVGFVDSFIARDKRERWRTFLASERRRSEITDRLNHNPDLDESTVFWLKDVDLLKRLKAEGAPETVYIISDEPELDRSLMSLADAVEAVQRACFGSVISCLPGILACYRGECGEGSAVLRKKT